MISQNSCNKEILLNNKINNLKSSNLFETEKKEYDINLRNIAKSLAKGLKNNDLRKAIKDEALLEIDGDYDILWRDFKNKKIKTINGEKDFNEFIVENIDEKGKNNEQKRSNLNKFANKYKRLQISVPVKCRDWETNSFEPLVTFVPYGF